MHAGGSTGGTVTGYVYGAIIVLVVLVSLEARPPHPLEIAGVLIGTMATVALAHAHAAISGLDYDRGRRVPWRAVLPTLVAAWPVAASAVVPAALFVAAAAGAVSLGFAFAAAQALICLSLFTIGYWSQRRAGGSVGRSLADGAIDLAFGLLIVALKLLID